jgi:hypothetical protein
MLKFIKKITKIISYVGLLLRLLEAIKIVLNDHSNGSNSAQ